MLHLVNNLFLCPDTALDTGLDRVVISQEVGTSMDPTIDETVDGYLYGYGRTYEETFSPNGAFPNLLTLLEFAVQRGESTGGTRFVIYADQPAFVKVAVNFYKAMLPNATTEDIYRIIRSYQVYERQVLAGEGLTFTTGASVQGTIQSMTCTRAQVQEAYTNSNIDSNNYTRFFQANLQGCGIEYLCASYSHTRRAVTPFVDAMKQFIAANFFLICIEVKKYMASYATERRFRGMFGLPVEYDLDTIEAELSAPGAPMRVLFLPQYWYPLHGGTAPMMHDLMNRITPEDFRQMIDLTNKINGEWASMFNKKDAQMLWDMVERLPEPDWSGYAPALLDELSRQLNEEELSADTKMNFLYWMLGTNYQSSINLYVLQYVFEQHRKNPAALQGFTINGV